MEPNTLPKIQGAFCAMMTPFDKNGRLSADMARDMVAFFIEKGLDGIFTVSNVGEFAALPFEEKLALIEVCCEAGKNDLLVCPGVTDFDYAHMLTLAKYAQAKGAAAVVLSAPIYYPYSAQYIERYIASFLDESPLPVIFYHSPKFAQPVSFDFLLGVMSHPNVAAVKESSGDAVFLFQLMEECGFRGIETPVMLGFEELLLTGLTAGASGCITSCGGIVPELIAGIINAYRAGDIQRAIAMQASINRLTMHIKRYGFPLGYKMAMKARGFDFRIIKSGLDDLEAEYTRAIPEFEALIRREFTLHDIPW